MTRTSAQQRQLLDFHFHNIRNITSPEDAAAGRKVYAGTAAAKSVLHVPNDENVRDYIPEAAGRKRKTLTSVHRAMFDTLQKDPSSFAVKNGGVVLVARDVEIDEAKKNAKLTLPSLINGAQTQGVLSDFYEELEEQKLPVPHISVKFEIIVTNDEELIGEVSIARNSQNNVDPLSIAGKKGVLQDLEESMKLVNPAWQIRMNETQGGEGFIDTPKLLQVTMALIPPELWPVEKDRENPNKVFTYSMRAKCLKDFQHYFESAHNPQAKDHVTAKRVYDFIVAMAPRAWELYQGWKKHQGFIGHYFVQGVTRDAKNKVVDVADGLIFPILAALANFVEKTSAGWAVVAPPLWEEKDGIFLPLREVLKSDSVKGNPWNLGKSRDSWSMLYLQTRNHKKMADKFKAAAVSA